MSYCRFGSDSDVYVYQSHRGLECGGCILEQKGPYPTEAMLDHLSEHREAGHEVPQRAVDRLRSELPLRGGV